MTWLGQLIRKLIGRDRYHDQANEVNNRGLRAELIARQAHKVRREVLRVEEVSMRGKR